jgi:transketolase
MKIEQYNIRKTIGSFLLEIIRRDKRIFHLSPDGSIIGDRAKELKGRYFDLGIAEQNLLGVAAGLAFKKKIVIVNSITSFIVVKGYLQLRNLICYHKLDVIILGLGSGLSYGSLGYTHHANEDLSLMGSLPYMKIYLPVDVYEVKAAILDSLKRGGPSYIRIGSNIGKSFYNEKTKINFEKPKLIKAGKDVLIIASGIFVSRALEIDKSLKAHKFFSGVLNINSTNIFNKKYLENILNKYGVVVCLEEHYSDSGIGNRLKIIFPEIKITSIGLPKELCCIAGSREELLGYYGLDNNKITNTIIKIINNDKR